MTQQSCDLTPKDIQVKAIHCVLDAAVCCAEVLPQLADAHGDLPIACTARQDSGNEDDGGEITVVTKKKRKEDKRKRIMWKEGDAASDAKAAKD